MAIAFSVFSACEADNITGKKSDSKNSGGQYGDNDNDNGAGNNGGGDNGGSTDVPAYVLCEGWTAAYHGRAYVEAADETLEVISVSGVTDPYFTFGVSPREFSADELSAELKGIYESCIDGDMIYVLESPSDFDFVLQQTNGDSYVYIVGIGGEDADYEPTGNYGKFKLNIDGSAYDNAYGDLEQYFEEGGGGGGAGDMEAPSSWTLKSSWSVDYVAYEEAYDIYYLSFTGITDDYFTAEIYDSKITTKADMDESFLYDAGYAVDYPDSYLLIAGDPEWGWTYYYGEDYDDMPGKKYVYIIGIDYDNSTVTGNYGEVPVDFTKSVVYDGRYDDYFETSSAAPASRLVRVKGSSSGKLSRRAALRPAKRPLRSNHCKVFSK